MVTMMKNNDIKLVFLVLLFTGIYSTTTILGFTSTTSSSIHSNQEQQPQQCYVIPRIHFEKISNQSIKQQQQKQRWRQRLSRKQFSVPDTTTDDDSTCYNECERILMQQQQKQNNGIPDLVDTTSNYNNIDRRETFFALLGTIWSVSSISIPSTILSVASNPQFANAAGSDAGAKIFIPNPYDVLLDRELSQQCLVYDSSSLKPAKPECNFLYKGTDNQIFIERIQKANTAFQQIPALVTSKKWSQITGIMTGPMGELIRTMVQLANSSSSNSTNQKSSKDLINVVKNDLYSITDGVTKKDSTIVLQYHTKTTTDLVLFLKSL